MNFKVQFYILFISFVLCSQYLFASQHVRHECESTSTIYTKFRLEISDEISEQGEWLQSGMSFQQNQLTGFTFRTTWKDPKHPDEILHVKWENENGMSLEGLFYMLIPSRIYVGLFRKLLYEEPILMECTF